MLIKYCPKTFIITSTIIFLHDFYGPVTLKYANIPIIKYTHIYVVLLKTLNGSRRNSWLAQNIAPAATSTVGMSCSGGVLLWSSLLLISYISLCCSWIWFVRLRLATSYLAMYFCCSASSALFRWYFCSMALRDLLSLLFGWFEGSLL